ncbi:phospholipase C [Knoellia remsis]|uniref:phospholipase C n=2 Tax=Knoellia remsis TaxID=407159 RepID=A0A2T0U7W7_9MICO|nr:phospholipase C [Knoellia remsis]
MSFICSSGRATLADMTTPPPSSSNTPDSSGAVSGGPVSSDSGSGGLRPSRRTILGGGTAAAALAATGSLLPASVHRAMAAPMRTGGLEQVEHVILLMQENRSYDHYYGTLRGVRGYGDRHPLRLRDPEPGELPNVLAQPRSFSGTVLPFSLREAAKAAGRSNDDIQYLGDLPHGFSDATRAWADGWWDQWVPAKTVTTMTYYDRRDIPLQYELSETFTALDAYHCSVYGSTNPNRNYFWTGTTGYEPGSTTQRAVTNAAYNYAHKGYDWTTYPERLEAAGVSWQIYQEWDNFTDNAVEYFKPWKEIGRKILAHVDGAYLTTEAFYDSLPGKSASEQDRLLAQFETGRASLSEAERSLFDRAAYRSRPGTLLERLGADIKAGTLPKVSWLVPTAALSEHPGASTPVGSANLIHDLLDLVASDLDTWSKTAILINFDENDGYFDHVPPATPPRPASGAGPDWYDGRPIGLGPRVPMTIVSPWTVGGFVDSSIADHTSTLRFLELVTGVREPNISDWRRSVCSDLTSAFDFARQGSPPALAEPGPVPSKRARWRPSAPSDQELPLQEPGRRPARALPYRPSASVAVEGNSVSVWVAGGAATDVPFAVYPYAASASRPEYVVAAAGSPETVTLGAADGRWDVTVQGPDRFWMDSAGALSGAAAGLVVSHEYVEKRPNLGLVLTNRGSEDLVVTVSALAYRGGSRPVRLKAGATKKLVWETDQGWYDVELTVAEDSDWRLRLTGHVETGRDSVTA